MALTSIAGEHRLSTLRSLAQGEKFGDYSQTKVGKMAGYYPTKESQATIQIIPYKARSISMGNAYRI